MMKTTDLSDIKWDDYKINSENLKFVLWLLEEYMEGKKTNFGRAFLGIVKNRSIYLEMRPNCKTFDEELGVPPIFSNGTIADVD